MPNWIMLDIETLSSEHDAQITTLGAIKFDPFSDKPLHSPFYRRFDISEQEALGRHQSESTLAWWAQQSDEAIEEAFTEEGRESADAILTDFKKYCVGADEIWSKGSFDLIIISNLCRQLGRPAPWAFWQERDCRTLFKRMPADPMKEFDFVAHNALEDSKAQALALRKTLLHFGMTK